MKKMGREEIKKVKESNHKILYQLLNALLGTLVFVLIYKIWLDDDNNYFYIFLAIILSGLLVSWTLRLFCKYFETNLTVQHTMKNFFIALIYATLVWAGGISWIFSRFSDFWDLIVVLMLTKLLVFLLSDFLSDKIAFGG